MSKLQRFKVAWIFFISKWDEDCDQLGVLQEKSYKKQKFAVSHCAAYVDAVDKQNFGELRIVCRSTGLLRNSKRTSPRSAPVQLKHR